MNIKDYLNKNSMKVGDLFITAWRYRYIREPTIKELRTICDDVHLYKETNATPQYVLDFTRKEVVIGVCR